MRPQTIDDLSAEQSRGPLVCAVYLGMLSPHDSPEMLRALADVRALGYGAEDSTYETVTEGTSFMLYRRLTYSELSAVLAEAQRSWDRCKKMYDKVVDDPDHAKPDEWYVEHTIKMWCKAEELPLPWPGEPENKEGE